MQTAMSRCGAVASSSAGLRQRDAASRGAGLRVAAPSGPADRRSRLAVAAKLTKDGPHVCVVGTTGAVGQEFLSVRRAGWPARAGRRLRLTPRGRRSSPAETFRTPS